MIFSVDVWMDPCKKMWQGLRLLCRLLIETLDRSHYIIFQHAAACVFTMLGSMAAFQRTSLCSNPAESGSKYGTVMPRSFPIHLNNLKHLPLCQLKCSITSLRCLCLHGWCWKKTVTISWATPHSPYRCTWPYLSTRRKLRLGLSLNFGRNHQSSHWYGDGSKPIVPLQNSW